MTATIHGRDTLQNVEIAATRDGRIQGIRLEAWQNCGAYLQLLTPTIPHLCLFMVPGVYDVQKVSITIHNVFTNTTPTDAYRGAGRPEATHMIERVVDALADELGLDPAELRRRNFIQEFPYTTATGLTYDSGHYEGTLARALELADVAGFEARRAEARARGNHRGPRALDVRRGLRARAVGRDGRASASARAGLGPARRCACTRPARRPS